MANVCINDKKIINNKTFLKIKKIIIYINKSNNLNLNIDSTSMELLISWLLITFSNKFVSNIFKDDKNEWFNIFTICNDFIKILNNFFIYCYEPGYSNLKEDIISNYELIMSILMRLNLNDLIIKKVDNVNTLNSLLEKNSNKKELDDFFDQKFSENNENNKNNLFNESDSDSDSENLDFSDNSVNEKNIFLKISSIINDNLEKLLINEIPNFSEFNEDKKKKIINKFYFNWTNSIKKNKNKKNEYDSLIIKFQEIYIKKFLSENEITELKKFIIKNYKLKNEYDKSTIKKSSLYSLNYNKLKTKKVECGFFQNLNLNVSLLKPEIISTTNNRYYINTHYLNITKILKENKNGNKIIEIDNIFIFDHLKNIKYYLNNDIYNDFFDKICKYYNLDKTDAKNSLIEKYNFNKKNVSSKSLQKENSKYYYLIIFLSLKDFPFLFENAFYLSYFFDFRGRFYSSSSISPVGNKIFRYLYYYGEYTEKEINTASFNFNKNNLNKLFLLIENKSFFKKMFPEWNVSNDFYKEIIKQVFFEIGKLKKSDYIYQYNGKFNEEDLINIGIEIFNNYYSLNLKMNFELEIEITYLINILKNYSVKKHIKSILYKDATASAIQLWMYVLKSEYINNYKICNLMDDGYWYDTYFFIIKNFLEENKINEFSKQFFKRSILKPAIMTYNYSATLFTIKNNILNEIKKFCLLNNIKYLDEDMENLIKDITNFYNFLEKFFNTKTFFESPSDNIINYLLDKTNINLLLCDGSIAWFQYNEKEHIILDKIRSISDFKKKKERKEIRQKLKILWISDKPNENKTAQAIRANFIHSLDALLIRLILQELDTAVITIHDSIGIDILNTDKIIKIANKCINKINFDNNYLSNKIIFYSPYIIL